MKWFAPSRWAIALALLCVVTTIAAVAVNTTDARSDDRGLECVRVEVERVGGVPGLDFWIMTGTSHSRNHYRTDANSEVRMTVDRARAPGSVVFRSAGFPSFAADGHADRTPKASPYPAWKLLHGAIDWVPATLDVTLVGGKRDWNVRWIRGVVPVALRCTAAGAATAAVRVVDRESWEEYAPDSSGVAYVLWTPERTGDVVVVAAGQAHARISADSLREAALATKATAVEVKFPAAREVSTRFEVPPEFAAGKRPCTAWAWDAATGVLVAASEFLPSAREVSFTGIGVGPVDVVLQAEDRGGGTWTATWRESDAPADRPATLQPSRVSYARSTATMPSITFSAWPSGTKCAAVRPAGVRAEVMRIETGLAWLGVPVAPGEYTVELEALPGATVPPTSITCRVRQGVVATVRFDAEPK